MVDIVKALAWPLTIFAIIYLLRGAIRDLASSIREGKVKFKDLEIAITRDLNEAKASIESVHKRTATSPATVTQKEQDLLSLAQVSPRAAILEAWLMVEITGAAVVKRLPDDSRPHQLRSPVMFGEVLRNKGLIPTEVMKAISKLRDIRNRTAHVPDFQPSISDAEEYVVLAATVSEDLHEVKIS